MAEEERMEAISVSERVTDNGSASAEELMGMADGVYRFRRGQLLNLEKAPSLKDYLQTK
jgi:hypothetical protein